MLENKPNSNQTYNLFEHILHEDTVFNERLNFFLVFESVIMGIVGVLYQKSAPSLPVIRTLIALAIFLTIIWGYVQARQKYIIELLVKRSLLTMPEYQTIVEIRNRVKWPVSNLWLLAYIVPAVVALLWLVLLFTLH
jgi:hypothetical protein